MEWGKHIAVQFFNSSGSFYKTNIFIVDYTYFSESEIEFGVLCAEKLVI